MKMIRRLAIAAFVFPIVIVILVVAPSLDKQRNSATSICIHMLGPAPQPRTGIADLADPQTLAIANLADRTALLGEDAYNFVTTLNRVTNWRELEPGAVARWIANPLNEPLPAGAIAEPVWPVPKLSDEAAATLQSAGSLAAYGKACATVAARVDAEPKQTTTTNTTTPSAPPQTENVSTRAQLAWDINSRIGQPVSTEQLWEITSPEPGVDARTMLLHQLLSAQHREGSDTPGDLACYDFTLEGPSHCSLILPNSQIAVSRAGTLIGIPIPLGSTIIAPVIEGARP